MKQKTHSGLKKRVRVKNNGKGAVMTEKSCKRHLLSNKSKSQKKSHGSGYLVNPTRLKAIRKLMPGRISVKRRVSVVNTDAKVEAATK